MYITHKCSSHLQRLNKEDTLKEGNNHGHQPIYGARFSKFQAIQHCEIARYDTGCDHQQPAKKNKPPG